MNKQVFFAPFRLSWFNFFDYRLHTGLPLPKEATLDLEQFAMSIDFSSFEFKKGTFYNGYDVVHYQFSFLIGELIIEETFFLEKATIKAKTHFSSEEEMETFLSAIYTLFGVVHHHKQMRVLDGINFSSQFQELFPEYECRFRHFYSNVCYADFYVDSKDPQYNCMYIENTGDFYFFYKVDERNITHTVNDLSETIKKEAKMNEVFIEDFMNLFKKRRLKLTL